ncbi:FHA domain-containing protein [Tsukamurella soli]|uniref:FHA domain-containing protein n=1 Tax=Tsukamurella soli TaxID=644556 RepID=A0ABP8KHA5_9ACTN
MPGTRCAACGGELSGRFCEECGHDRLQLVTPAPAIITGRAAAEPPAAQGSPAWTESWVATVSADRGYFDTVVGDGGPDDGGWSVVDLGSANGTVVGDSALPANTPGRCPTVTWST